MEWLKVFHFSPSVVTKSETVACSCPPGYWFHKLLNTFTKLYYCYKDPVYKYNSTCRDLTKSVFSIHVLMQGRIQDFKLGGGAHLKKLRRAEEGAKILGVFRVKNHYFTQKNHSFYNYGGRREKFWGISCEKSRFYAKKTYFFPILGGARAGCAPLDPPL